MKPLIVANWKANPSTILEAKKLFVNIKKGISKKAKSEIVVCPPFIFLPILKKLTDKKIKLGAQDVFWKEGAFTGQISAKMIKSIGCKYVIVGHSESRAFGETDEMINKKIKAIILTKLSPILCVGETKEERKKEQTKKVLKKQLEAGLKGVSRSQVLKSGLVVAYEPIWAIGAGKPCSYDTALSSNILIRNILFHMYNQKIAKAIRIIYGGSVVAKNVKKFIDESAMEGVIIGGASLKPKEFTDIVKAF